MTTYIVKKSQRGLDGKWFSYKPALRTENKSEALAYAERFATEQRAAGVVGTRINVMFRGQSVAEFRV